MPKTSSFPVPSNCLKDNSKLCIIVIVIVIIEIINNTREGIAMFFSENKRECGDWGANSSPGCRVKR